MKQKTVITKEELCAKKLKAEVVKRLDAAVGDECVELHADNATKRWLNATLADLQMRVSEMIIDGMVFQIAFEVQDPHRFGHAPSNQFVLVFSCSGDWRAHLCREGVEVEGVYFAHRCGASNEGETAETMVA